MSSWPPFRKGVETAPTATVLSLPQTPELLSPLLAVVPMQILTYQMAALKGVHPDTFRRDNPTYVAALSLKLKRKRDAISTA
jgi:glucosamine 6-phosphate synthetase-like amidotransferase/phosphosugar isomerase protein